MAYLNSPDVNSYYSNPSSDYQFQSLESIIDYFMITYVGEDKILKKIKRYEVSFHAHRALAELSFDTLKSFKSQEVTVPASLTMPLPIDYINYTKISWSDNSGIEHIIYPVAKTSNPTAILQDDDGNYGITEMVTYTNGSSTATINSVNKNLKTGMTVESSYCVGCVINNISYTSSTTVITLNNNATASGEISTSISSDELLLEDFGTVVTGTGIDIPASSNTLTVTSTTVEKGMEVIHPSFFSGTTVTSVNGTTVVLSGESTNTTLESSQTISFKSTENISTTWSNYKSNTPSENNVNDYQDYENNIYWPNEGERYGLEPQHAQINGSFYIDQNSGKIHFSSNLSGKNIVLKYISDSLGTDGEMQVHKFAEEAMYKCIMYSILCVTSDIPEYQVRRYKKEKFAATRKAKLRLSNIKLEEITQVLRGKSKQIKH